MAVPSQYLTRTEVEQMGFKSLGVDVLIHRSCNIVGQENISIGSHVRIDGFTSIIASKEPCSIGHHVHIASYANLAASGGIDVEDFAGIASGTKLLTASDDFSGDVLTGPTIPPEFTSVRAERIVVGRHSVIGAGCVVLPGTIVEQGVLVGALSLARGTLSSWSIYVGCPARRVKERRRGLLELEARLTALES